MMSEDDLYQKDEKEEDEVNEGSDKVIGLARHSGRVFFKTFSFKKLNLMKERISVIMLCPLYVLLLSILIPFFVQCYS